MTFDFSILDAFLVAARFESVVSIHNNNDDDDDDDDNYNNSRGRKTYI